MLQAKFHYIYLSETCLKRISDQVSDMFWAASSLLHNTYSLLYCTQTEQWLTSAYDWSWLELKQQSLYKAYF